MTMPDGSATAHLYRPKLVTVLFEGYNLGCFRRDVTAALTVAIVAAALSMAIAVASGVPPALGLYAAVIGAPGVRAWRKPVSDRRACRRVYRACFDNGRQIRPRRSCANGFSFRTHADLDWRAGGFGALIRYIWHAVTVGFTCGIAVTIFASQLTELGGLTLPAPEPGPIFEKLAMLGRSLPTLTPAAFGVGVGSTALIFVPRWLAPNWPGMLIAVVLASLASWLLDLPLQTIGSRFGELPHGLPAPRMPSGSASLWLQVLPAALSFTLLGAVESLLSAKVADGMTGRKHRYNMELVAQGIANVVSSLFGGVSVTGTIARTATNIRAGACSPLAGMMHAVFVLLFMLIAAPLARFIPLSALAGVLVVVCWNMAEKEEFLRLLREWRGAIVLAATFGLTLLEDLTVGIVAGCVLAALIAGCDAFFGRDVRDA